MVVHYDKEGHKVWVGQDAEQESITVYDRGDRFCAWDTGNVYEVLDGGVGWELVMRGLPIPPSKLPHVEDGESF